MSCLSSPRWGESDAAMLPAGAVVVGDRWHLGDLPAARAGLLAVEPAVLALGLALALSRTHCTNSTAKTTKPMRSPDPHRTAGDVLVVQRRRRPVAVKLVYQSAAIRCSST